MKELPLLEVEWEDHYSTTDWVEAAAADVLDSVYVKSVGYLFKETKNKLVLVQNMSSSGQLAGTMTIMKKTIKTRTVLREGAK